MAGYIRQDTTNQIANDEVVDALYLDQEFDAIVAAFNSSTGHTHDGTTGQGAPVTVLGPAQNYIGSSTEFKPKSHNAYDIGTDALRFKDGYFNGTVRSAAFRGTSTTGAAFIASSTFQGPTTGHYTWDGDSNTSMYHPAFDTIHFATNGSDRLTISSAGVVGVTGNLTVAGTITSTGAITGNVTGNLTGNVTGNVTGAVTGNATTATALQTARTIAISTGATGTATSFDGSANITIPVTALNADYISAGTLAEARLPAEPTTWFRASTVSAHSPGQVGTFAFLKNLNTQTQTQGETLSGSVLRYSGTNATSGGTPSGTWMCLGRAAQDEATLWIRIA